MLAAMGIETALYIPNKANWVNMQFPILSFHNRNAATTLNYYS